MHFWTSFAKKIIKQRMSQSQSQSQSQSVGLSTRHITMHNQGEALNDESKISEETLNTIVEKSLKPYAETWAQKQKGQFIYHKQLSLYELQKKMEQVGGPPADEKNKKVYMKPDGGIFIYETEGREYLLLMIEDKLQGTNDRRLKEGKPRQATGNAIERGAKNIRGAEMLTLSDGIFPYALFASGCDFHHSETIARRLEMANYGIKNHNIYISATTTEENIQSDMENILENINIKKRWNKDIASIFIKAHKWDEMEHGASVWKAEEREAICKKMMDQSFAYILSKEAEK